MQDMRGVELQVDDTVIYNKGGNHYVGVQIGTVLSISNKKLRVGEHGKEDSWHSTEAWKKRLSSTYKYPIDVVKVILPEIPTN